MITFKTFLEARYAKLPNNVQVAWSEKGGDTKKAVKWIVANNLKAIEDGDFIFRGFSGGLENSISFIDSSTGHRMSRDSSGIYQLMMDVSEAFKDYPSRSNSFICTTDGAGTKRYGQPYIVFPKAGTKIAISEDFDFWESSIAGDAVAAYGHRDIESLTVRLSQIIRAQFHLSPKRGMTMADLDEAVARVDVEEFLDKMGIDNEAVRKKIADRIQAQGGKNYFTALSNIIATPDTFGVETIIYGKNKLPSDDIEMWFSGEALIVDPTEMEDILKELPEEVNINRAMRAIP